MFLGGDCRSNGGAVVTFDLIVGYDTTFSRLAFAFVAPVSAVVTVSGGPSMGILLTYQCMEFAVGAI